MHQHQEAFPSNPPPLLHRGETPPTDPFRYDFIVVTAFRYNFTAYASELSRKKKVGHCPAAECRSLRHYGLNRWPFQRNLMTSVSVQTNPKTIARSFHKRIETGHLSESEYCKVSVECIPKTQRAIMRASHDSSRGEVVQRRQVQYTRGVIQQLLEGMFHTLTVRSSDPDMRRPSSSSRTQE